MRRCTYAESAAPIQGLGEWSQPRLSISPVFPASVALTRHVERVSSTPQPPPSHLASLALVGCMLDTASHSQTLLLVIVLFLHCLEVLIVTASITLPPHHHYIPSSISTRQNGSHETRRLASCRAPPHRSASVGAHSAHACTQPASHSSLPIACNLDIHIAP